MFLKRPPGPRLLVLSSRLVVHSLAPAHGDGTSRRTDSEHSTRVPTFITLVTCIHKNVFTNFIKMFPWHVSNYYPRIWNGYGEAIIFLGTCRRWWAWSRVQMPWHLRVGLGNRHQVISMAASHHAPKLRWYTPVRHLRHLDAYVIMIMALVPNTHHAIRLRSAYQGTIIKQILF